jgi:hypothetical protein
VATPFLAPANNSGGTIEAIETSGVSISDVLVMDTEDTNAPGKSISRPALF